MLETYQTKVNLVPTIFEAQLRITYDEYEAPTITSITPNIGPTAGGTEVVIAGDKYNTDSPTSRTVEIDENTCTSIVVDSDDQITCDTPAGTGIDDLEIEIFYNSGTPGTAVILSAAFTYADTPTVTAIAPNKGSNLGGTAVKITGSGFSAHNPDSVNGTIGGAAITDLSVVSDTEITGITPAGTNGDQDVVINCVYGNNILSETLSGGYTYSGEKEIDPATGTEKTIAPATGTEKTIAASTGTEKVIP